MPQSCSKIDGAVKGDQLANFCSLGRGKNYMDLVCDICMQQKMSWSLGIGHW